MKKRFLTLIVLFLLSLNIQSILAQDSYSFFIKAKTEMFSKNFSSAIENINKAIIASPSSREFYVFRGLIYFEIGDYDNMFNNFNEAKVGYYNTATCSFEDVKYDLNTNPCFDYGGGRKYYLLENILLAYYNTGNYDKVLENIPEDNALYNNYKALSYLRMNNYDKALYYLKELTGNADDWFRTYDLKKGEVFMATGLCYLEKKQYTTAFYAFLRALRLQNTEASRYLIENSFSINECAGENSNISADIKDIHRFENEGYYQKAIDAGKSLNLNNPFCIELINIIARDYLKVKEFNSAELYYQVYFDLINYKYKFLNNSIENGYAKEIIYTHSDLVELLPNYYLHLLDEINPDEIVQTQFETNNVTITTYYKMKGRAYYKLKDYDRAINQYNIALSKFEHEDYNTAIIYSNLAGAYFELNNLKKALETINKALTIYPHNSTAFTIRGYIYIKQGKFDKALSDLEKATEIDSSLKESLAPAIKLAKSKL
ncbi:MAG: tetratricopeptide repeat protein [Ignavibacteriae bacterium]|nr:tetratricopeptide repeat protein [Ignavibacteriota bacterium]